MHLQQFVDRLSIYTAAVHRSKVFMAYRADGVFCIKGHPAAPSASHRLVAMQAMTQNLLNLFLTQSYPI